MSYRGRRNQRRGRSSRGKETSLRAMLHGMSLRGKNDPPSIVVNPWNSVTLVSRGVSTGALQEFKAASMKTLLISQLGLTGLTAKIEFRFMRIDVWLDPLNVKGLHTSNLGLLPASFNASSVTPRAWIEDMGSPVLHAHCHYIWPLFDSQMIVLDDYSLPVFSIDTKIKDLGFSQHVHILWRSSVSDPVPSYRLFDSVS